MQRFMRAAQPGQTAENEELRFFRKITIAMATCVPGRGFQNVDVMTVESEGTWSVYRPSATNGRSSAFVSN
jgi:hypothetical protein